MDTLHNPDRFMSDLRQILSQGRKRIGLLAGAGAPLALKIDDNGKLSDPGPPGIWRHLSAPRIIPRIGWRLTARRPMIAGACAPDLVARATPNAARQTPKKSRRNTRHGPSRPPNRTNSKPTYGE
jgi:hypothetical protein